MLASHATQPGNARGDGIQHSLKTLWLCLNPLLLGTFAQKAVQSRCTAVTPYAGSSASRGLVSLTSQCLRRAHDYTVPRLLPGSSQQGWVPSVHQSSGRLSAPQPACATTQSQPLSARTNDSSPSHVTMGGDSTVSSRSAQSLVNPRTCLGQTSESCLLISEFTQSSQQLVLEKYYLHYSMLTLAKDSVVLPWIEWAAFSPYVCNC